FLSASGGGGSKGRTTAGGRGIGGGDATVITSVDGRRIATYASRPTAAIRIATANQTTARCVLRSTTVAPSACGGAAGIGGRRAGAARRAGGGGATSPTARPLDQSASVGRPVARASVSRNSSAV